MSFETDWSRLKRQYTEGTGTQTNLAGAEGNDGWAGGTGGDKSGNLKTHKAGWTAASKSLGDLRKNLQKALTTLADGQKDLGPGGRTGGIESGVAQREVYASWKRYLEDVSGRCGALQGRMTQAGQLHHTNDDAIRGTFADLADKYKDTAEVGGREGRR